jgi:uncharacterized protein (TIGR02391 family)
MKVIPHFSGQQLEAIAKVLADTETGLTGSEIGHILDDCRIPDINPEMTKWKRLYNALLSYQNAHNYGNHVIGFIHKAMNPVKYTLCPNVFNQRRNNLNEVLAFSAMHLGEDGKLRPTQRATNISEAKERANRLQSALKSRNVHQDVLKFCSAELLQNNYFHAVFEAMKSIASKIRSLSGLTIDGAPLVEQAFAIGKEGNPLLAINPLTTETDKSEQKGFVSLLTGLFGVFRNPLAHNAKIEWDMDEQDALDILTTVSLIHRKLDKAYKFRK